MRCCHDTFLQFERSRNAQATKEEIWDSLRWRRSNFILTMYMMGLFCLLVVEFSFWQNFGAYYWYVFLAYVPLNMLIGKVIEFQLKEALLTAPVGTGFGIVQGITTLAATDFLDFLLGYFLDLALIMLFRVYVDPYMSDIIPWVGKWLSRMKVYVIRLLPLSIISRLGLDGELREIQHVGYNNEDVDENKGASDTVEPILDSFGSYSADTLSLFYFPYTILLLWLFRDQTGLAELYGIKVQDMMYYLWFGIIIIFFQV